MQSETKLQEKPAGRTLYVIFHGELIFTDLDSADFIRVRTPLMDEHVFMAGPWLGERHVPVGSILQLYGVRAGNATIHKHLEQFVIFKNAPGNDHPDAHFDILVPRPRQIHEGQLVKFDERALVVNTPGVTFETPTGGRPSSLDLRPIFEYEVGSSRVPFLGSDDDSGEHSSSWPASEGIDGFLSLHIFAEPDQSLGVRHVQMAFRKSAMLLGVDADVEPSRPGKLQASNPHIPGLHPLEYCLPLRNRVIVMQGIGQSLRRMEPITFPSCPQLRQDEDKPLRIRWLDPGSCGPIGN